MGSDVRLTTPATYRIILRTWVRLACAAPLVALSVRNTGVSARE
jgi:hypothetical protein